MGLDSGAPRRPSQATHPAKEHRGAYRSAIHGFASRFTPPDVSPATYPITRAVAAGRLYRRSSPLPRRQAMSWPFPSTAGSVAGHERIGLIPRGPRDEGPARGWRVSAIKKGARDNPPHPCHFQSGLPDLVRGPGSRVTSTPPFVVTLADGASIRHRRHFHSNFERFVTLHRALFRPNESYRRDG